MTPEIIYFIKVNIAIALFYTFYRLFCCKDTFFHWRRFVLLAFLVTSFLYPFLDIQEWVKQQQPINNIAHLYASVALPETKIFIEKETDYSTIILVTLKYIYLSGTILLSIRFLLQLCSICYWRIRCPKKKIKGVSIHLLKGKENPFSFFKWIFINLSSFTPEEIDEILTHEKTHAQQYHTLDILLSEIGCIICWINPFIWLLKENIRLNLEYLADNKVLHSGYDSKNYQYHLLKLTHQKAIANLYNNFNVLPIKNRIKMMNKKRSKNMEKVKYALFFPLFAFLMLISNIEAVARIGSEITADVFRMQPKSDQKVPKKVYQGIVSDESGNPLANVSVIIQNTNDGTVTDSEGKFKIKASPSQSLWFSYVGKAAMTYPLEKAKENMIHIQLKTETTDYNAIKQTAKPANMDNAVFQVVEKMPEYPGGMKECINFLTSHINYPAQAKKEGLQGRVIVQFVVTKSGAITNPTIVRGVSPELDAEALRVVKMMPDWTPGTQRGIPVNVNYTIPIVFRLPSK